MVEPDRTQMTNYVTQQRSSLLAGYLRQEYRHTIIIF